MKALDCGRCTHLWTVHTFQSFVLPFGLCVPFAPFYSSPSLLTRRCRACWNLAHLSVSRCPLQWRLPLPASNGTLGDGD